MRPYNSLVYVLAVLTASLLAGSAASAATILVLQTFDYPGIGNSTLPQKISDQGVIVGTTLDASGVARGFFYKPRIGRFSDEAFSDPSDTGNFTQGRGVNNSRHAVGEYLNGSDGTFHGYLLEHPDFISIDVAGAVDTMPLGINNADNYAGTVIMGDGTQPAFVSLRGNVTMFAVPDAAATLAYQLNRLAQIVGYYVDLDGVSHGYMRDTAGNLTYPIDVAGATGTILFGNNDSNWVVGRYTDAAGLSHGLFFMTSDDIVTFDYPGATYTSLNGINKGGFICGYYLDSAGIFHGIWAKVNVEATGEPNTNMPLTPVKPAHPLPDVLSIGAPAM